MNTTTVAPVMQSEYFEALLSSIDTSVVATDENFIVRYWNRKAEQLFGIASADAVGRRGGDLLRFIYPDHSAENARETLKNTGRWKGQVYFKTGDDDLLLLDASVTAVKNGSSETIGFVGIHRDVTAAHQTATALSTFLSLVSSVDDYFFMVDKNMKLVWVNESANKKAGADFGIYYKPGEDFVAKMPSHRQQQVDLALQKTLGGEKTSYEAKLQSVDGKDIWVDANYFPVKDTNGNVTHACGLVRDITQKKEEEQSNQFLYKGRMLFETFMENSPILAWVTDRNGVIRYLNPAYLETYRLPNEVIGKSVADVFPAMITSIMRKNDLFVIDAVQTLRTTEKTVMADANEKVYEVVKFPIATPEDEPLVGGWAIDVTEEINLREKATQTMERLGASEKELKEALAKEQQLSDLKSRFVSMASHEFRTPLSTILSSVFLIEKYTAAEHQTNRVKHTGKIKEAIQHLNDLLDDFLSLGKLEEGKVTVQRSGFDLELLCADVLEETSVLKKERQTVHFCYTGEQKVESDKKLIKNILTNLLTNAYKFTEKGAIWFEATITNNKLIIAVKDEGMGISPADQQHLFETFFRAKNAQNIQGTGLGLHIVQRCVKLLNGDIKLHSELNKGTTVEIELPLSSSSEIITT